MLTVHCLCQLLRLQNLSPQSVYCLAPTFSKKNAVFLFLCVFVCKSVDKLFSYKSLIKAKRRERESACTLCAFFVLLLGINESTGNSMCVCVSVVFSFLPLSCLYFSFFCQLFGYDSFACLAVSAVVK